MNLDDFIIAYFCLIEDLIPTEVLRQDLFDASNQDELVQALLAPSPDITASSQAISSEAHAVKGEEDENSDESGDNA